MSTSNQFEELLKQLELLSTKQIALNNELQAVRAEIELLRKTEKQTSAPKEVPLTKQEYIQQQIESRQQYQNPQDNLPHYVPRPERIKHKTDIEKFIGENLISKIGIIILVIGVGIGARFAIEHSLISPMVRTIGGYLFGFALLALAFMLKQKYHNYSAVLLSGSMAIFYFISFAAFSFYDILPQPVAFVLLLIFTVFTVFAAINYNQQVIAHIGLVGAYSVPFLIGSGSNNTLFLFIYITIINAGIFTVALKRYWKPLHFLAFLATWSIYLVWYAGDYTNSEDFALALVFLCVFFVLFFLTFIFYKLLNKGLFNAPDIILLTANSFVFYGLGYAIISGFSDNSQHLGLFTLVTAFVHLLAAWYIFRLKLADKNLFYLLAGLVLVFLTIVFPVQFDGNWVTLFWAGEALVLLWICHSGKVKLYAYLSFPVILLAFISLVHDWTAFYGFQKFLGSNTAAPAFYNVIFLTSLLTTISLYGFYYMLQGRTLSDLFQRNNIFQAMLIIVPVLLIITAYFTFELEIARMWQQKISASAVEISSGGENPFTYTQTDSALGLFKSVWIINYTLLFSSVIMLINSTRRPNNVYTWLSLTVSLVVLLVFLTKGLYSLSELRDIYLQNLQGDLYPRTVLFISIRYIAVGFAALPLLLVFRLKPAILTKSPALFDLVVAGAILWVLTSELLNWLDIAKTPNLYKLALSIFWGIYALLLVIIGIWKNKTHLRIAAFCILGFTLLKLFFYDLSDMKPLSRAVLFIALGMVMLGVSFLYNKYKSTLFDEQKS
ncbi:MAG: DUF2339 domain-containing protein [Bacteroidales bacterium]|nr:DUF2339 domain-containing protein [Bacteroidales bacterium]